MIRNLLSNPRRVVKTLLGTDFYLQVDRRILHERFGSEYGGWDVVTEGIDRNSAVYSFGVGKDASFDLQLIERFGLTVHAFDPTPESISWVEQQNMPAEFVLHACGLAAHDGNVTFYPPDNPDHVSHSLVKQSSTKAGAIVVPVKCLQSIMTELKHEAVDILKMDIEGAEYEVLKNLLDSRILPRQILVEFHHRFIPDGIRVTREIVRRMKKSGYCLFSVSASVEEFCFLKQPLKVVEGGRTG
jgi:FkbM family methyltransferase